VWYIRLLPLLGERVVFRDPFLGFRFGIEATEEARTGIGHVSLTRQNPDRVTTGVSVTLNSTPRGAECALRLLGFQITERPGHSG
jgi:hypothetical protein